MSVLIKGMGMPTGNDELRLIIRSNGQVIISHKTYYEETEVVPVPPHGDLIEKDVIEKAINDACAECKEACIEFDGFFADCDQCILHDVKKALLAAPTIIPASEEGE